MRLFIAEKPEVARVLAKNLGGQVERKDGYFVVGNDYVTYCFGHLLQLFDSADYNADWKKWDLANLPYKIEKLQYKPIDRSKNQLKVVTNLLKAKEVTEIIHAGDPDQEGQILVEEILDYVGNTKPVKRILPSDLTDDAIKNQLANIQDNSKFEGLKKAGYARSWADWIIGINLTVGYTKKAQEKGFDGVLSVGRVQSPILWLVYNRDMEHENHQNSIFYTIKGDFEVNSLKITTTLEHEKIEDKKLAEEIVEKCKKKDGKVKSLIREDKKTPPPLPYNLLALQIDASNKFKYSADKTLKITQALREKYKLITYNRSDCQYIPENFFPQTDNIFEAIKNNLGNITAGTDTSIKGRAFDDSNITAHHAIIPTSTKVNFADLSTEEQNIYTLIAKRYILQFFLDEEYEQTNLVIECENYNFKASSKFVKNLGWKDYEKEEEKKSKKKKSDDEEDEELSLDLTSIKEEDEAKNLKITAKEKTTKPKAYYTEGTLLKDLTNVAKYVTDEKIKKLLISKDVDISGKKIKGENGGLGTPATRSEHIKTLFDRGYIVKQKNSIVTTKLGRDFIKILPELLAKPDLTALWAEQQKLLEENKLSLEEFIDGINKTTKELIENLKKQELKMEKEIEFPCPKCNGELKRFQRKDGNAYFWACRDMECKTFFPDKNKKPDLDYDYKAPEKSEHKCPKCEDGYLIRRESVKNKGKFWYGCSNFSSNPKCSFTCFENQDGKPSIN